MHYASLGICGFWQDLVRRGGEWLVNKTIRDSLR
jgi:hypothetical protein